ncbi:MAG: phosphotransferase [Armatimonas sp.]
MWLCANAFFPFYGFHNSAYGYLLQHGDNDTYFIQHDQHKYILRVWSKDKRLHKEIEAEMELLDFLVQHHVPVVQPLLLTQGGYLTVVQAPEGERMVGLFHYAPGTAPGKHITSEHSYPYGRAVAEMHQAWDSLKRTYPRAEKNRQVLLEEPVEKLLPAMAHRPADCAYLIELALQLRAEVSALETGSPVYGLCHCDLHKNNLLWFPESHLTLMDFDTCGYSWRAYDLAVLFWSTRYLPQAREVRHAYLQGYNSVRPLKEIEMQMLPYFVAIRDIYIAATECEQALRGTAGSSRIDDDFFDEHLAFLHAWMDAIQNDTYQDL